MFLKRFKNGRQKPGYSLIFDMVFNNIFKKLIKIRIIGNVFDQ